MERCSLPTYLEDVYDEVERAKAKHAPPVSSHEGYAVILEELDELWEHVKANTGYSREAYDEAKQVAATAIRYMEMAAEKNHSI